MTWSDLRRALAADGLVSDGAVPGSAADAEVTGVTHDSRRVRPGHVFVALKGLHADGAQFVQQAVAQGAVAVVTHTAPSAGLHADVAIAADPRRALACLAAAFWGHPSREMRVVGITGTNGKTTTAYLVASIFEAAGVPCGLIGTVGYRIRDEQRAADRTTPEAPEVQALLREMVNQGCGACAMEVSSHALALGRVDGTRFAAGVFTNLTREHLDFHASMDDYFQAKRRLFEMLPRGAPAIVNVDDPRGAALVNVGGRTVTYAVSRPADVTPGPLSVSLSGLTFDVHTSRGRLHIASSLVGRPNVYNILAAVSTTMALDVPLECIERGVASLEGVPGRFQVVSSRHDAPTVVVDYAHTDDALRNLLETARPLTSGRVVAVFGCGGDRDRTKRPLMGAVAGRLSDVIVITSDNPRGEDPVRIIDDILRGITPDTRRDTTQRLLTISDRRAAIMAAVDLAGPGDLVLIAGKGHEKQQVVGSRAVPFDDVAVAREALARRRSRSGVA
jgi:UDP-N-acetylmuramoyl-L-alanyl-D-glutamate--2,6-diaminopimelate ligase